MTVADAAWLDVAAEHAGVRMDAVLRAWVCSVGVPANVIARRYPPDAMHIDAVVLTGAVGPVIFAPQPAKEAIAAIGKKRFMAWRSP